MRDTVSKHRLRGQKVMLREPRLDDAVRDYAWRSDPELARLDAIAPLDMPFSQYLMDYETELRYLEPGRRFAVDDAAGKHIGHCMHYAADEDRGEVELGILIGDRNYWNKGYGQDAVATLVDYIFNNRRMERIYLHTLDENVRAQKCFRKCGFVECSRVSRDGYDFLVMELWRRWWGERRESVEQ